MFWAWEISVESRHGRHRWDALAILLFAGFVQPGEFSFRWGLEKNMSSFRLHGRLVLSAEHYRLTNLQPREPTGRRSSWIRSWRGRASQQLLRWRLVQRAQSTSNILNSLLNDFDLKASCSFVCLVWSCRNLGCDAATLTVGHVGTSSTLHSHADGSTQSYSMMDGCTIINNTYSIL